MFIIFVSSFIQAVVVRPQYRRFFYDEDLDRVSS